MKSPRHEIELLAPAGNLPSFYAAIHNGADAVYLGAASFGARSSAGFNESDLRLALRYAHLYDKRVYITLNTLMKESELSQAAELLRFLDDIAADALIVQDLGLLGLIKQDFPSLPIHASTQMSIHNAAGARFLLSQGVNRAVLARECGMDTIAEAASIIQTEVFVHGAQCVSISGQCLLSSQIGGRSGNRGRCAQPCRMTYRYRGQEGAWLSPRDLAQIDGLGDLLHAGVSSLKIEGRLKRPEYVAIVTKSYRQALDRILEGHQTNAVSPEERKELLQIYNRGGFTQGWAFGQSDAQLINPKRVSHDGTPLGVVLSSARKGDIMLSEVELSDSLRHGDHLQIRGLSDQEMIYSGREYHQGDRVSIRHHQTAKAGDAVYKLTDALQLERAKESSSSPPPNIALTAKLHLEAGAPSTLTLSSCRASVVAQGQVPQPAQSQPMDQDSSFRAIQKTGGSPFYIETYAFESSDACFMPVAALNALRREALEKIQEAHIAAFRREIASSTPIMPVRHTSPAHHQPALYVRSHCISLIDQLRSLGMNHFLYAPQDYTSTTLAAECEALGKNDYLCLPRQASDSTLYGLFELAKQFKLSLMADNVGQLSMTYPAGLIAGPGIPAWNNRAQKLLKDMGCEALILSAELSKSEIQTLDSETLATILPVYGRTMVMQLNHCPERSYRGLWGSQIKCRLCQSGNGTKGQALIDRLGARFPIFPTRLPEGCLNALLFHTPLHLSKQAWGKRWLLDFTVEDEDTILSIVRSYKELLAGSSSPSFMDIPIYMGRFEEGVT